MNLNTKENKIYFNNFKKIVDLDHSKWIIALTDGEDNSSRITYEALFSKLKKGDVNLMIVGLALGEKMIPPLSELCKATSEGVFIESPEIVDIEMAFQAIANMIFGTSPDIIVESFN